MTINWLVFLGHILLSSYLVSLTAVVKLVPLILIIKQPLNCLTVVQTVEKDN